MAVLTKKQMEFQRYLEAEKQRKEDAQLFKQSHSGMSEADWNFKMNSKNDIKPEIASCMPYNPADVEPSILTTLRKDCSVSTGYLSEEGPRHWGYLGGSIRQFTCR